MELGPSPQAANRAATHEIPSTLWTRSFVIMFTRALHWSLSSAGSKKSIPFHPISLRSILITSTYLRHVLPSDLFPTAFPTNILYAFPFFPVRATCPAHLILHEFIMLITLGEEYKLWNSLLCSFFPTSCQFIPFGPNTLLNTLFSNNLSLCSSLNVREQVSHPYRTTGKMIIVYILILMFLDSRRDNKGFWTEW
jgi:hypothetical protein